MRAMLVSFLTHHLWQPWQAGVHHLARLFLDYEPGIHYPQFQMQAGVTGINTIRIYNPVKQGLDHDADGLFIKAWLPALQYVPAPLVHTPWKLTPMEQMQYRCRLGADYPWPVVDVDEAARHAREQLWRVKASKAVKQHNRFILQQLSGRSREDEQGA
jgi:deoxyribodipyrimidine photo-lyase